MNTNLPPVAKVRAFLEQLGHAQVQQLSTTSGVPFTTLWKIRDGTTTNPGIETVRKFWPELATPQTTPATAAYSGPDRRNADLEANPVEGMRLESRRAADRAGA